MSQRHFAGGAKLASVVGDACGWLVHALYKLISIDVRSYQPERYFMRGPGPAWRAKHASDRNPAS